MALVLSGVIIFSVLRNMNDMDSAARTLRVAPPEPPADLHDFVGSTRCATCHEDIAQTYQRHPMARSAGPVLNLPATDPSNVASESFDAGRLRYQVDRRGDDLVHHAKFVDAQGETICDHAVDVRYAIGSGVRGQSYLIDRGGILFQSPISFYTKEHRWDLSPGYPADQRMRFERRVGDTCLFCHAGRVASSGRDNNYGKTPFLEASIGCERCHGPGRQHVELYESVDASLSGETLIVNPVRLEPGLRDSVCFQCHLSANRVLRYGRQHHDFRPGQAMEDVWTVFVKDAGTTRNDEDHAVSHVQQMRSSKCYLGSERRLTCVSCHDPHQVPLPERKPEFYRNRCLKCHNQRGCRIPLSERLRPPAMNSCIHCHMPHRDAADVAHTTQTDHRIPRSPLQPGRRAGGKERQSLTFFDGANKRLPEWEAARARGLAILREFYNDRDRDLLDEAERLLSQSLESVSEDTSVLSSLGQIHYLRKNDQQARAYLETANKLLPDDEETLELLAIICSRTGDYDSGLNYLGRFIKLNPWRAEVHARRSHMQAVFGDLDGAIDSAERGLNLDPSLTPLRAELVDLYKKAGRNADSRRHSRLLDRIEEP